MLRKAKSFVKENNKLSAAILVVVFSLGLVTVSYAKSLYVSVLECQETVLGYGYEECKQREIGLCIEENTSMFPWWGGMTREEAENYCINKFEEDMHDFFNPEINLTGKSGTSSSGVSLPDSEFSF